MIACAQAPQLLLGHFCSIITSLLVSPDGQYIVSTDRDHKIRVTHMPADPMQVCISPCVRNDKITSLCTCQVHLWLGTWHGKPDEWGCTGVFFAASRAGAVSVQGAHEIQSYCLGHTSFVTCAAFLLLPTGTVLVSGAGDGSIR